MRRLLVVLIAAAFMVGFAVPAMSQPPGPPNISDNWTIDGRVGYKVYYNDNDEDYWLGSADDSDMNYKDVAGRVRVKYKSETMEGEIDFKSDSRNTIFDNYWAERNMGSWFLLVGYFDPLTFNPADAWSPEVTVPVGVMLGHDKDAIIRGRFPMGAMTLSVAAIAPDTSAASSGVSDVDVTLPAIEVKLDFVTGGVPWAVVGGYQTYDAINTPSAGVEYKESLDSYVIGVVARPKIGPVKVSASFYMEQNNYMDLPPQGYGAIGPSWDGTTGPLYETDAWGFHASMGYQINPMIGLNAGFGMASAEDDADNKMETMTFYGSLPIKLDGNWTISPYFTYYDAGDYEFTGGEAPMGSSMVLGSYFQVVF